MNLFEKLKTHDFVVTVLNDGMNISLPSDSSKAAMLNKQQEFYVKKLAFFLASMMSLLNRIDIGMKLLCNLKSCKNDNISRSDHLLYNVENYIIRLCSVNDRMLQLVNAALNLNIEEQKIRYDTIKKKIEKEMIFSTDPKILETINRIEALLKNYSNSRNIILHRYDYEDESLRNLELLYLPDLGTNQNDNFKRLLTRMQRRDLKECLLEKKNKFSTINLDLATMLNELFNLLHCEYKNRTSPLTHQGLI